MQRKMVPKLSASIPSSAVVIGLGTVATVAASYAVYQHVVNRAKFKKLGTVSFGISKILLSTLASFHKYLPRL